MRLPAPLVRPSRALLAAIALASAGCEGERGGPVRVLAIGPGWADGAPAALPDPAAGPLAEPSRVLLGAVAQGLVRLDRQGEVVGGLAERWTVSNDGLSYIFRLGDNAWDDGRPVRAREVVRALQRQLARASDNPMKDPLGVIDEIVSMTDRVIEIRLIAPRPGLLALLAQPEMAVVREGAGGGPFRRSERSADAKQSLLEPDAPESRRDADPPALALERRIAGSEDEEERVERLTLAGTGAGPAIAQFVAGKADLVLGGTVADLPLALRAPLPRGALRFDPVGGLFGLVAVRADGPAGDLEVRRLLAEAIDRAALVAALRVDGLSGRTSLLQPGLEGMAEPEVPAWSALALDERRPALAARARTLFGAVRPTLRLRLPEGLGGEILLARLQADWRVLGVTAERAGADEPADLALLDLVAPTRSPAWYLRQFRCAVRPVCVEEADSLLAEARKAPYPAQRAALLAQAARLMEARQLFVPLAAPIRWSLVAARLTGFSANPSAVHPLSGLRDAPGAHP